MGLTMNQSVVYLLLIALSSVLVTVLPLQRVHAQTVPSLSQNQELLSLYEQGLDSVILQQYSSPVTDAEYYYLASSYVRLGQYNQALLLLSSLVNSSNSEQSLWWSTEASLAQSRVLFHLGNYASALEQAFDLSIRSTSTSDQKRRAAMFLKDIFSFLSPSSLAQLFTNNYPFELKASILEELMYGIPYELAKTFYSELQQLSLASGESNNLILSRIERQLSTPIQYRSRYNPTKQFGAPDGFHYRLGVLLPTFSVEDPRYAIVQDLYRGMSFAAEEFNANTPDAKMFLIYKSTTDTLSSAKQVDTEYSEGEHFAHTQISSLVIGDRVNAIIGPLFSNEAPLYAPLAEEFEIPLFLPLANADSLDLHNNYMFQVNPSFSSQGAILARYAVETLGFDTLGILAEKGSLGEAAAHSFLRESERLGAFVAYDFIENLEERGYGITDFTQYFSTDTLDSVTIIDAVYAPFTGTIAQTLIESLLTDLEAMQSTIDILGSEEWGGVTINSSRLPETDVHFSRGYAVDTTQTKTQQFTTSYEIRYGSSPTNFSYIGYDVAHYVMRELYAVKNAKALKNRIKTSSPYKGHAFTIDFRNTHINSSVFIQHFPSLSTQNEDN
jgi:ABC-type branched-subunit amino acid transport system substrate-binding protein